MSGALFGKTVGERLFEQYLNEHGLPFQYQPDLGEGKRPDYLVEGDGSPALCEVTDLESGEMDKPVQAELDASREERPGGITTSHTVGVSSLADIGQRIQGKVIAELEQLGPFRGRHPLVVVIHNTGSLVAHLDDIQIRSAMSEFLTPQLNTDLSAIAVVGVGRPGERELERALRGSQKGRNRSRDGRRSREPRWPTGDEVARGLDVMEEEDRAWRGALTEEHPHLHVYHNYYAKLPLPPKTFPAPNTTQSHLIPNKRNRKYFDVQKIQPSPSRVDKRRRS